MNTTNLCQDTVSINGIEGWYVNDGDEVIYDGPFATEEMADEAMKTIKHVSGRRPCVEFGYMREGRFTTLTFDERGF